MKRASFSFALLQIGLSLTFLYAGVDMVRDPSGWLGWFPHWLTQVSPLKDIPLLYTIGVGHIILAVFLLIPKYRRGASILAALFLFLVLATSSFGSWSVIFRDIGVLGAALALAVAPGKPEKFGTQTHPLQVGAICVRVNAAGVIEVLCAKRSALKHYYSGFWEGSAGGGIHDFEDLSAAALRHLKEDYGVGAHVLAPVAPFEIEAQRRQPRILGIKFLCAFDGFLNGTGIVLDESEYTEWRWQPEDKLDELSWIPGTPRNAKEDIREAIAMYKRVKIRTPE